MFLYGSTKKKIKTVVAVIFSRALWRVHNNYNIEKTSKRWDEWQLYIYTGTLDFIDGFFFFCYSNSDLDGNLGGIYIIHVCCIWYSGEISTLINQVWCIHSTALRSSLSAYGIAIDYNQWYNLTIGRYIILAYYYYTICSWCIASSKSGSNTNLLYYTETICLSPCLTIIISTDHGCLY